MKKKVLCTIMSMSVLAGLLAGCGSSSGESAAADTSSAGEAEAADTTSSEETASADAGTADLSGEKLEVATYLSGDILAAYKEVLNGFEEETGVKITLDEYGDDYESTMKTRMASNDLPDIFETHGWSLIRYKGVSDRSLRRVLGGGSFQGGPRRDSGHRRQDLYPDDDRLLSWNRRERGCL